MSHPRWIIALLVLLAFGATSCRQSGTATPVGSPAAPSRVVRTRTVATAEPPTITPAVTAVPVMAPITLSQAPLQRWSDPNNVTAVLLQGDDLWAATSGGVVRWNLASSSPRIFGVADGLASEAISGLAQDGDGHIWVGYGDQAGWSEWDGDAWHNYATRQEAAEARYTALLAARQMTPLLWEHRADSDWIWLATPEGGLMSYDGSRWRSYGTYQGVTSQTWLVDIAPGGRVWGVGGGISTCDEGEVWWDDHSFFSAIAGRGHVTGAAVDSEGGLWLSYSAPTAAGGGVCRFDQDGQRWEAYTPDLNPAVPGQALAIEVDEEDTLWVCGQGGIAYHRKGQPWRRVDLPDLSVTDYARKPSLAGTPARLYLATTQGVYSVLEDGSDLQGPWRVPASILGSEVSGLVYDKAGALYVATRRGVSRIGRDGETQAVLVGTVNALRADPAGAVWAATLDGLYRIDTESPAQHLADGAFLAVAFGPQGIPWVCDEVGRLLPYADGLGEPVADLAELAGALPRDMDMDAEGTLWFATEEGLGRLTGDGEFSLATEPDQLLSSDVRAVRVGVDGLVWMATAKGLARWRPDGRWTRFTPDSTEGGLQSWELWNVCALPNGQLWVASEAGISWREPENADWAYYPIPEARCIRPDGDALWIGTRNGLYRLALSEMIAVK